MLIVTLPGARSGLRSPHGELVEDAVPGLAPFAIDVDTAPWYEWALLEGIGEARARRIEQFVAARRPLASIDELREVPGLPAAWVDRARPYLRLAHDASRPSSGGARDP